MAEAETSGKSSSNTTYSKGANPTLLFRTVGEIGSALYAQNPVLMELLHEVIQRLTPTNPAITFEEKSMQSLRIAMKNLISSGLNIASFPLQNVLVVVTCEDSKIAPTCKVRVFLISLKDLLFFANLDNCRNVQVEAASNFPRIATLHQLAKLYLKLGEGNKSGTERDTVFSTLQLALRQDYTPISPVYVRWGEKEKELLATMGIQA